MDTSVLHQNSLVCSPLPPGVTGCWAPSHLKSRKGQAPGRPQGPWRQAGPWATEVGRLVGWWVEGRAPRGTLMLCTCSVLTFRYGSFHCLYGSTWLPGRFFCSVISVCQLFTYPCLPRHQLYIPAVFSGCPCREAPLPRGREFCFWKGPCRAWLEILSCQRDGLFWQVESCVGFSRPSCWFRLWEGVPGPGCGVRAALLQLWRHTEESLHPVPVVPMAAAQGCWACVRAEGALGGGVLSAQHGSAARGDTAAPVSWSQRQSSQEADLECQLRLLRE